MMIYKFLQVFFFFIIELYASYYENKFWYIDGKQTDFLSLRTLESEFI